MIDLGSSSDVEDDAADLIDLFKLDGVVYQIPAKFRANVGLKMLDDADRVGAQIATIRLLRTVIGDEGYDALLAYKGLSAEHLEAITDTIVEMALGAVEDEKASESQGKAPAKKPAAKKATKVRPVSAVA